MGGATTGPAMLNVEFDRSCRATGNAIVTWCDVGCRDSSGQFQDKTDSATCSRAPPHCAIGSLGVKYGWERERKEVANLCVVLLLMCYRRIGGSW
jgi:hypothetical protein